MTDDLETFLRRHQAVTEALAVWASGAMPLRVTTYLARVPPPLRYVTSVRSLVFRGDAVLVLRDPDGAPHLLPGGRREAGEHLEATVRREVLEETGWNLESPIMLGFLLYHHLNPRPTDYVYPYPDFVQVVYLATAVEYQPDAMVPDEYVADATFRPVRDVLAADWTQGERLLLEEALTLRKPSTG